MSIRIGAATVYESTAVEPGSGVAMPEGQIVLHPLDVIALLNPDRPYTRLQAATMWILSDAYKKFDAAVKRLQAHQQSPTKDKTHD